MKTVYRIVHVRGGVGDVVHVFHVSNAGAAMGAKEGTWRRVAPRWRPRGSATSARGRRRLGVHGAGERRSGDIRRGHERVEGSVAIMRLTAAAQELARFVGGEENGGGACGSTAAMALR